MQPELGFMKKEEHNYTIPLTGLAFGHTEYQYVIEDDFFAEREYSEVRKGVVNLKLDVEKMETMFILTLKFDGNVVLQCDRCGDDYMQPIANTAEIYLKYGAVKDDEDNDVIIITKNDSEFDISDLVYEYIILSLPIHRTHAKESDCNQKALETLKGYQQTENDTVAANDNPAWKEMMKDLKEKLDN